MPLEAQLSRNTDSPGRARKLLAEQFVTELVGSDMDLAKLLTSELVTNAVVHGEGTITLRAELDETRLLVEVIDEGHGFERPLGRCELPRNGGWGLKLVESESSRWGIFEGTTHVWFELERPDRPG